MTKELAGIVALLLAATLAACSPPPQEEGRAAARVPEESGGSTAPPAVAVARARGAAMALAGELMGRLAAELGEGGPARAVAVCAEVAQEIAAAHSTGGAEVRRVSLEVRNPADRPDAYEQRQLERLAELDREGRLPDEVAEVVEEAGGPVLRYLKPIRVQPLCLQCHGDPSTFDPAVRRLLAERYPGDEAVGYAAGDLRGAISVRLPLDGP